MQSVRRKPQWFQTKAPKLRACAFGTQFPPPPRFRSHQVSRGRRQTPQSPLPTSPPCACAQVRSRLSSFEVTPLSRRREPISRCSPPLSEPSVTEIRSTGLGRNQRGARETASTTFRWTRTTTFPVGEPEPHSSPLALEP